MSGAAGAVAPWDVAAVLAVGPIWWLGGKAAQRARLPLITGYLLVRSLRSSLPVQSPSIMKDKLLAAPAQQHARQSHPAAVPRHLRESNLAVKQHTRQPASAHLCKLQRPNLRQAGMLVGPAGLGLLREAPLERLMTLERGALGVIALAAGAELRVAELHRTRRQARTDSMLVSGSPAFIERISESCTVRK